MREVLWMFSIVFLFIYSSEVRSLQEEDQHEAHHRFIQEYEGKIRHNQKLNPNQTGGKKITLLEMSQRKKAQRVNPPAAWTVNRKIP